MKHTKLFSILMLLFLGTMAMSLTACSSSSDNDDVDPTQQYRSQILGEWYCDNISYWFGKDGTGWLRCGDVIADFKYTIGWQSVRMRQFTYVDTATGSIWKDDDGPIATYDPEQNTLRIEERIFTRQKPTPQPTTSTEETQRYRSRILGDWYCDDISYRFEEDGTGWRNCGDIIADFKYTIAGQGVRMFQFTYVNTATGSIWKNDEGFLASYDPEQNILRIEGYIFTREKPEEEPTDTAVTDTVTVE